MTNPSIYRLPTVEKITGLRKSTIYSEIAKGKFPAPVKLTEDGRAVGWLSSEIGGWIDKRIALAADQRATLAAHQPQRSRSARYIAAAKSRRLQREAESGNPFFELSTRARNALTANDLHAVEDIQAAVAHGLLKRQPGCGKLTTAEILAWLEKWTAKK